jgi:hypothetical protein
LGKNGSFGAAYVDIGVTRGDCSSFTSGHVDSGYCPAAFLLPLKQQPNDPVVRFETQPVKQMQVDFTVIRQGRNPLLAFVATLGWSRATFVRFYPSQDTAAWCDGQHEPQG